MHLRQCESENTWTDGSTVGFDDVVLPSSHPFLRLLFKLLYRQSVSVAAFTDLPIDPIPGRKARKCQDLLEIPHITLQVRWASQVVADQDYNVVIQSDLPRSKDFGTFPHLLFACSQPFQLSFMRKESLNHQSSFEGKCKLYNNNFQVPHHSYQSSIPV